MSSVQARATSTSFSSLARWIPTNVSTPTSTAITQARRIADFRNQLTHEYPISDDEAVWVMAQRDVPVLRAECEALLARLDSAAGAD